MYQHGKRTNQPRSFKILIGVAAIVAVAVVIGAFVLSRDLMNRSDPQDGEAILTQIGEDGSDKFKIDEPLFKLDLPADWKLQERRDDENINFYLWISTKQGGSDRKLTLYIDRLPAHHKLVRLLPVTPNGAKLTVGNMSGECIEFAGGPGFGPKTQGNAPVAAKWENVSFMCDPTTILQTVGTGSSEGGIRTTLTGPSGQPHSYFFFYEDHNIHPDYQIFESAVRSFEVR